MKGMAYHRIQTIAAAFLAFLGTLCLPSLLNLEGKSLVISNSWFGVFFWTVCFVFLRKTGKEGCQKIKAGERRGFFAAHLLAFLFAAALVFGVQLDSRESVVFTDGMVWLSIFVWGLIFGSWLFWGFGAWEEFSISREMLASEDTEKEGKSAAFLFLFYLLCWLPVFLAVYPGFFVYDAQDEFVQAQTRNFTTHHPLPHVVLLGGIILAVNKLTGSYNMGIAAYTLFQMLLMAGVFTYVVGYMKRKKISRRLRILTALYFALFPVIVMFTLCSAKDGIFSAAFLLLLLSLTEMAEQKGEFFKNRKNLLLFGISAVVMMSFRHNGMYAFLVLVPFLLVFMKGCRKKTGVLLGSIFAVYFLLSAGLTAVLSAEHSESQEMLTVPIQQLARVYQYDRESLTEEQLDTLYEILPEEVLAYYTPKVSDGVKIGFQNEAFHADPGKYVKLWAEIGLGHPFTYLNAWFMTSYGFWYPDTVIDVYRGNSVFTFTYGDSSFFGYEVEQPGVRESKLPRLNEWYRRMSLEIAQQKVPVVSMLFSPGFLFWVFAFAGGYAWYRKKYTLMPAFALLLLLWLTVILGPTYLPRYVLVFWFALPGAAAVLTEHGKSRQQTAEDRQ